MEVFRIFVGLIVVTVANTLRGKRADICPLDGLGIQHGSYEVRSGTSILVYTCDEGYLLYGPKKLYCIASSWTDLPPKCITNTCRVITVKEPLRVQREYNGSLLRFSCAVMNRLEGSEEITCNGTSWTNIPPICIPTAPATSCDFESPGLCGWVHHDDTDVQWRLQMGSTKTSRTGPRHDHTFGASGKDVALLEVYIKPETQKLEDLNSVFSVSQDKGDKWLSHNIQISQTNQPFQILIVATRGASFRSDIAIDDVALYTCPEYFPTTKTSSTSTTTATLSTTQRTTVPLHISTKTVTSHAQTTVPVTSLKPSKTSSRRKSSQATRDVFTSDSTGSSRNTVTPLINPNLPVQESKVAVKANNSNLIYILVGVALVIAVTVVVGIGIYFCRRQNRGYTMDTNGAVNPLYSAMANDEAAVHFANDME